MKLAIIYHVYKNSASLRKSLESIFAQTDQNFEFVFVNDYASSKVNQIIKEISFSKLKNFTYITHSQNLGHSYSFNNAVKAISSEYVLYAGSNFIFDKNFIKIFNKIITHNPNTDVISFNVKNNDASFSTFNKLNVKMKQTIQSSMKDKIVATKMIRNFNLGLNENFYSPLVFIYQILFLFKKWIIVDFSHAKYLKHTKYTYNLYDIFEENDYLLDKYSNTKFWRSNQDIIQYLMIIYILWIFIPRMFMAHKEKSIRENALHKAEMWLRKNIPHWRTNKILFKTQVLPKKLIHDLIEIKFKIRYIDKLIKKYNT